MYEHIKKVEVKRLSAFEVAQCLFYLHALTKEDHDLHCESQPLREELKDRLRELRNEKDKVRGNSNTLLAED
ncbi:hypothetical protein [Pontibacter diazotrophicus]|uniref:hypothetical protein n=1 Tax=Pontibacter diazotrophicus TaxID=1400979 RepID=UPI0011C05F58|nr:hypothetical protein [Pontibacter diazotrophicus]